VETSPFVGGWVALAFGGVFSTMLAIACFTDLRSRRIPNRLVGLLALLGIAFSIVTRGWSVGPKLSLIGLAAGFAIWIGFYAGGVLGAGDVKLAAAVGAWLGPTGALKASLVGALAGGVLALMMLVRERRAREAFERIFVVLSTRSLAPLGTPMTADEQKAPRGQVTRQPLPYGVALAIGALIVAWLPAAVW